MKRTLSLLAILLGCLAASLCPAEPILAPDQPEPAAATPAAVSPVPLAVGAATPVETAQASEETRGNQQLLKKELTKFVGRWRRIESSNGPVADLETHEYVLDGNNLKYVYYSEGHLGAITIGLDVSNTPEIRRRWNVVKGNQCLGVYEFSRSEVTAGNPWRLKLNLSDNVTYPTSVDDQGNANRQQLFEKLPERSIPDSQTTSSDHDEITIAVLDNGCQAFGFSIEGAAWIPLELDPSVNSKSIVHVTSDLGIVQHGHQYHAFSRERLKWATLTLPVEEILAPTVDQNRIELHSPSQGECIFISQHAKWIVRNPLNGATAETSQVATQSQPARQPSDKKLRVFPLQYRQATPMATALQQMYPDGHIKAVANLRTNSVLVTGTEALLIGVNAEVRKMEETAKQSIAAEITSLQEQIARLKQHLGEENSEVKRFEAILAAAQSRGTLKPGVDSQAATGQPDAATSLQEASTASNPQVTESETKVFALKNCVPDGLVKLLKHRNPSPAFQAFGNNQTLRLVLIGTPEDLASAETTVTRLQELIAQIKEGDNKLYELLKSLGTEHPDVLKLNAELEALDAEIVKLEAGLNHYVPPRRIEEFKTPPQPAPAETEAAAEPAPNATSDFQLKVVLNRTKPTEAACILKLVINDDRFTAEPVGDNIVRVQYRSATKAEVEAMASVLEQLEKPETATQSAEPAQGTTPVEEPQSLPLEPKDASPLIGKWRVFDREGEGQGPNLGMTFEFSREGDNLFATINNGESTVCPVILNRDDDQQNHVLTIQGQDRTQQSLNMVWVYRIGLTKSQDGNERPFLFVLYSTDGTVPKTITETGKMLRQMKLMAMSPDEVVAMGLPSSAIPGRQFVVGLTAIVAIANDHKTAYAYCENNPAWVPVHLEDVQAKPIPIASGSLVAVQHGHQFHAYSTTRKAWDTLVLNADETAAYTTDGLSMTVTSPKSGIYVFKEAWGKWFSAKEIKAGKVAEHLASFDLKSPDSPSPALPGADTPTTPFAEPQSVPPSPLVDYTCKHRSAEAARRLICALYPNIPPENLVADMVGNRMLYLGTDNQTAKYLQGILPAWDQRTDGPIGEQVRLQVEELQSQLIRQKNLESDSRVVKSLELRIAALENALEQDGGNEMLVEDRVSSTQTASVKVFALQHAQATDAAEVLKQVYDRGPSKIVPDARTNSVIVTGPEGQLKEIEALLLKLDEADSAAKTGLRNPRPVKHVEYTETHPVYRPGETSAPAVVVTPLDAEAAKLIVQLQDEQTKLLQDLGPQHPKVVELQARIDTARKSAANTSINNAASFSPDDTDQWTFMAYEIAQELKKDQEAISRLHGPNGPRVTAIKEAINSFKEYYGELIFADETDRAKLWAEWQKKYQSRIEKGPDALRAERDQLIEKNNSENREEIEELELLTAWATVQQRYRERDTNAQHGVEAPSPNEDAAARASMVNEIIQELQKEREAVIDKNLGMHSPRVDDLDASIAQIKADNAEVLVSAMIQQSVAANGLKEVVSLINKGIIAERAERDKLIETDPTNPRIREIDIDIASSIVKARNYEKAITAAESGVLPDATGAVPLNVEVREATSKEYKQQVTQLRKEYQAADQQAHQLAEQLKQSPDESKQAELRKVVQRAFTARQTLLRAELMEMQTRLLQTQRSIEMRDRISDQIIQRRVEDLLNPQLKWESSPAPGQPLTQAAPGRPGTAVQKTRPRSEESPAASAQIPPGMLVFTFQAATGPGAFKGLLHPGDRIDVLLSYMNGKGASLTKVVIEHVEVFAAEHHADSDFITISILVTPEQARFAKVAQTNGQLSLSLRNPNDKEVVNLNGINSALLEELKRASSRSKTDESRWRSAVVEILVSGKPDVSDPSPRLVGLGIVIAADGTMISQMGGGWATALRDWPNLDAQFDDGSVVPLQMVDEGGSGFVTLRPKQGVNLNHYFPLSGTTTATGDAVYVGQMVVTNVEKKLYGMSATAVTLTQTDRRVATLAGLPVWQLTPPEPILNYLCHPVLNTDGELLAITLVDTGGLLLAVPVEKLREMMPTGLSKLATVTATPLGNATADPEAEALAKLQGKWHLTIRSPGPVLSNPDTYEAEAEVEGNLMKVFYTSTLDNTLLNERFLAHTVMIQVGEQGTPPQIDLLFGPNEERVNRFLALGITEFSEDMIRLCFDRSTDSESIRPKVFAVGAKAAIWELRRTPPVESKAGILARLQGLWVAEFETGPNGASPEEAKHPEIIPDLSDFVFDVSGNVAKTSFITPHSDKPDLAVISLQLGDTGTPQPVDILWKTTAEPEGDGHFGIMEFSGDEVRVCFGDVKDRPQVFAAVKDYIYLVRLKRPSRESLLHLGVQLAPAPVGPDQLKDTPFRGGLRVEKVYAGTPAAEGGLLAGDVLVGLHVWEMTKPEDLQYALGQSLKGEVSFHVLRDGHIRKGFVLLDGSKRPDTDAGLSPDQLTKIPVEIDRGHSVPAAETDPKAAMLAKLQGVWEVKTHALDPGKPNPKVIGEEIEIAGNMMTVWAVTDTQRVIANNAVLTLGEPGPPQQIDMIFGPNDGKDRLETFGLIEINDDLVRICVENCSESKRPEVFAVGNRAEIWELRRKTETGAVTELEGDWHRVAVTAVDGTLIETPHFNATIRGTTWTNQIGQTPEVIQFQTNLEKKTIEFSSTPPVLYAYELDGNRLILRDKTLTMVLERGHLPAVVVEPTELEGDWHLAGEHVEQGMISEIQIRPSNLTIRGDKFIEAWSGHQMEYRLEADPKTGEIRKYSLHEEPSFQPEKYERQGDRLILRDIQNRQNYLIYKRGHVRLPVALPQVTDTQRQKWRSGIVELFAEWNDEKTETQQKPIGYGTVISDQGWVVGQVERIGPDTRKYLARCDDGSLVPLDLKEDDVNGGWFVFQAQSSTQFNHAFPIAHTETEVGDAVWAYLTNSTLPLITATLTSKDRRVVASGLPVWQLDRQQQQLVGQDTKYGSLPVLNGKGELLGLSMVGTGELSLALPVTQFNTVLSKTLGKLSAPTAPVEPTDADKVRWKSAVVDIVVYGKSDALDGGGERVLGRGVVVSENGLILTHLAGGWATNLHDWKILAKFDDGSQVHLSVAEDVGGGLVALQPKEGIQLNHVFRLTTENYSVGDELYVGQKEGLAFGKSKVILTDRKITTGPSPVWQLEKQTQPDLLAGQPVLSASGELVALTLQGTGELLLAVPMALLKELFPKTLGQGETDPVHVEIPAKAGQARSNPYGLDMTQVVPVPNHKGFESGLLVDKVQPGSPADRQGIRAGDILVGLGTWGIDNLDDAHWMMQQNPPDPLKFFVIRDGEAMSGHFSPGPPVPDRDMSGVLAPAPTERPVIHQDSSRNETALLGLGLRFQPTEETPQPGQPLRGKFLVEAVQPNSVAARARIQIGDQLVQLGPKQITSRLVLDQVLCEFHSNRLAYQIDRNGKPVAGVFRIQAEKEPTPVEASSSPEPAPNTRSEQEIAERLKALHGTWAIDYFEAPDQSELPNQPEIRITGNQIVIQGQAQGDEQPRKTEQFTFDLTSASDDRAIDLFVDKLPGRDGRVTVLALYEITGETLALCFTKDGPRPKEFGEKGAICIRAVRKSASDKPSP